MLIKFYCEKCKAELEAVCTAAFRTDRVFCVCDMVYIVNKPICQKDLEE